MADNENTGMKLGRGPANGSPEFRLGKAVGGVNDVASTRTISRNLSALKSRCAVGGRRYRP